MTSLLTLYFSDMNPYTFYTYFSEMLPGDITNFLLPLRTIWRLSENPDLICDVSLSLHFLFTFFSLLNVLYFFLVKCKSGIKHNLQKYILIFVHFLHYMISVIPSTDFTK